jgi:mevalonate kinase
MAILEYGTLYAKLLLAGEYSILMGGGAIALPLKEFPVHFGFLDDALDFETARDSNLQLMGFYQFLANERKIKGILDLAHFESDLKDGLYLLTTVPSGYGLGSSGVVCAAVYKTYCRGKKVRSDNETDFLSLRSDFSLMEAYFHGKSSGIDPLSSFLGKPLHICGNEISMVSAPVFTEGKWFLLDTASKRKTGALVNVFLANLANHLYRQELENQYLPVVNEFVNRILHSNSTELADYTTTRPLHILMEAISNLQLRYFHEMILPQLVPLWQQGLDTGLFYLKLLGAGGGGYFLGFTSNPDATIPMVQSYGFELKFLELK